MKKIITLFLIVFLFASSEVAQAKEQSDIKNNLIFAIGLLENSEKEFQLDDYITNSELVKAIYVIMDLPLEDYSDASDYLIKSGFIGTIGKEKEAAQADNLVRAMVNLLGYRDENYKKAASEAGLYKNVSFKNRYVTRDEFIAFVYNTLIAEKFELAYFKGDSATFEKKGNILEDRFNIKRVVGVVNSDYSTGVGQGDISCKMKGAMGIGNITIQAKENTKEYLGRNVEAFLKFDDNSECDAELVAIEKYKNSEYKATSEYIDGATSNNRMVWIDYRTGKKKQKNIPAGIDVIFNGKRIGAARELAKTIFTPADGEVIMIDNDNDGDINVIIVWSSKVYLTEYASVEDEIIYDKSGEIINLKNKEYLIYDIDGEKVSLADIQEFDVLNVAFGENPDDEIYIVKTSENTVSGTYKRIGYSALIGKDEYSMGAYCRVNNVLDGDFVQAYLDMYNRIAYVMRQKKYEYGYITKAYYDEAEEKVLIKLYTFDEGVQKLCLADKVTIQNELGKKKYGGSWESAENLYAALKDKNELIKYKINSDGRVNLIIFATSKIGCDVEDTSDDLEAYYGISAGGIILSREAKFLQDMFVSNYIVGEDTILLSLEGTPENPENFRQLAVEDLVSDSDYYVKIYDVNMEYEAGIVVIDNVEDWYVKYGSIVESVSEVLDENDEICLELTIYNQGEKKTITANDMDMISSSYVADKFYNRGAKISEISIGDIIFYNEDKNGKISSFAYIYKNRDFEKQGFYHTSNYGWGSNYIPNAGMALTYCNVKKKLNNMIVADIDGARPIRESTWRNYYICENGKLRTAGFSDIRQGDRIVGLWKWSNLNDVVIYR